MAARYFVNGGVDNNWGTTGNWSLTDGGAGGQAVPTASDDVHFTSNSPNCTVNTSARVCLSLDFTGYTNTITMSQQITVSGSVTLVSAMTISGSGTLIVSATSATLTSNTKVWPNEIDLNAGVTFADDWTVSGLVKFNAAAAKVINGFTLTCNGGLTNTGSSAISGTTAIVIGGGTVTTVSSARIDNAVTLNSAGTITFAAGSNLALGGNLTYTAGTIAFAGAHTLTIGQLSATIDTGAVTWSAITFNMGSGKTITLSSKLAANGLVTVQNGGGTSTINGSSVECNGGLTLSTYTFALSTSSTTEFKILAAQTITGSATVIFPCPVTINAPGAAIVITTGFIIDSNKFKLTAVGSITNDSGAWALAGGGGGGANLLGQGTLVSGG